MGRAQFEFTETHEGRPAAIPGGSQLQMACLFALEDGKPELVVRWYVGQRLSASEVTCCAWHWESSGMTRFRGMGQRGYLYHSMRRALQELGAKARITPGFEIDAENGGISSAGTLAFDFLRWKGHEGSLMILS